MEHAAPSGQHRWLLVDNASNVHLVCDPALRSRMYDLLPIPQTQQFILMNAHPLPVLARGSLDVRVACSRTGVEHLFRLRNVAFCEASAWNILSWSAYADQLALSSGQEPLLLTGRQEVGVPTAGGARVWGTREGGIFRLHLCVGGDSAQVVDGALAVAGDHVDPGGGRESAQVGVIEGVQADPGCRRQTRPWRSACKWLCWSGSGWWGTIAFSSLLDISSMVSPSLRPLLWPELRIRSSA